jgi:hypothetical protein
MIFWKIAKLVASILRWSNYISSPDEFERLVSEHLRKTLTTIALEEVKRTQDNIGSDIRAIHVALKGIVTKYEHEYLRRLADPTPFPSEVGDGEYHEDDDKHHYTPDVYPRLKRLDDIGFIRPKELAGTRHLLKIVDDHAGDESKPNEERPRFKLRDYVEITDAGRNYLALAGPKYL